MHTYKFASLSALLSTVPFLPWRYRVTMAFSMSNTPYNLDHQIGYLLRKVNQRHLAIFADAIPQLTTTQFAALARLAQLGPMSQNRLGRETAMDAATIKGVVERLIRQGFVTTAPDPNDRRRLTVSLTEAGALAYATAMDAAFTVTERTLSPLTEDEAILLHKLLSRMT